MNHERIETVRTFLSPISDEDHAFIYKGMSNHEVTKYYSVHFDTLEDTLEQMRWYKDLLENKTGIWWTIRLKEGGVFAGAIGFNDWDKHKASAEIGFWLLPDYWKKGYVTEALPVVIDIVKIRPGKN